MELLRLIPNQPEFACLLHAIQVLEQLGVLDVGVLQKDVEQLRPGLLLVLPPSRYVPRQLSSRPVLICLWSGRTRDIRFGDCTAYALRGPNHPGLVVGVHLREVNLGVGSASNGRCTEQPVTSEVGLSLLHVVQR